MSATTEYPRQSPQVSRKTNFAIGLGFLLIGGLFIYISAVRELNCVRKGESVDCEVRRKPNNLFVLHSSSLKGLREAQVDQEKRTKKTGDPGYYVYRVFLIAEDVDLPLSNYGANDVQENVNRINRFLSDSSQNSLVIYQEFPGAKLGFYAGSIMFTLGLLSVMIALSGRPSDQPDGE